MYGITKICGQVTCMVSQIYVDRLHVYGITNICG